MNIQNRKIRKKIKHLEEAMFENRIASANDCTGMMNTLPDEEIAENISDMLNVPTSKPKK